MLGLLLFVASGASVPSDQSSNIMDALRSEMQPFLVCDRRFDFERYALNEQLEKLYKVANQAEDEQRLDFDWDINRRLRELNGELGSLEEKISTVCQRDETEQRLKIRLFKLRPANIGNIPRPWDVSLLASDVFKTVVRLERDLASFSAGKYRAPDPPSAPIAPKPIK